MEVKSPVHPGLLVKECLDDLGLSVAEVAKGLGVTRQQLHNVIAGRSNVTPEMAIRFEKAFGRTADMWLRMQMNYDLAQMRKRAAGITVERLKPKVARTCQ
jgi:antitoxin HigA-1